MQISHLFAGKPIPFGPRSSPSSIIKKAHASLRIMRDGAVEDEQGNKKLHGGPYMALHQFAQDSYSQLAAQFPHTKVPFDIGSIGENLSAPNMDDHTVFIGDQYKIGSCVLQVVSPRAPCSKINQRYQNRDPQKIDLFVAQQAITGWYYSVLQEGDMQVGDAIELVERAHEKISIAQIWRLRELIKNPSSVANIKQSLALADLAINTSALSPEWQAYMNRTAIKLAKLC
jgi:MOSC domain-containing protein YiiM